LGKSKKTGGWHGLEEEKKQKNFEAERGEQGGITVFKRETVRDPGFAGCDERGSSGTEGGRERAEWTNFPRKRMEPGRSNGRDTGKNLTERKTREGPMGELVFSEELV